MPTNDTQIPWRFRTAQVGHKAAIIVCAALAACGDPAGGGGQCPAPAPRDNSNNMTCTPQPGMCPHRGGDPIHDICADGLPPNVAWDHVFYANQNIPADWYATPIANGGTNPNGRSGQGCDVSLSGREFDAMSWDSMNQHPFVWEIKTINYTNQGAFQQRCILQDHVALFRDDCMKVVSCNQGILDPAMRFQYRLAFNDQGLYNAMRDHLAIPANTAGFPTGWADFCNIDDAQRCR